MEWSVKIHRKALKFLENLQDDEKNKVSEKINELIYALEKGSFLIYHFDIKKLRGKWNGFFRLRVGNIRIIFKIDLNKKELIIYHIHYRGKVYR